MTKGQDRKVHLITIDYLNDVDKNSNPSKDFLKANTKSHYPETNDFIFSMAVHMNLHFYITVVTSYIQKLFKSFTDFSLHLVLPTV